METYFRAIEAEVDRAYARAEEARATGIDPELHPEIPRAQDMASRVEKLLQHLPVEGIAEEIRVLCADHPREEVALTMARRLAADPKRGDTVEARLDCRPARRPRHPDGGDPRRALEGLAEVHMRTGGASGSYVELYYAGPIRAAGGTAQALSVLLADLLRRDLGIGTFSATPEEVGRYQEEIPLYKHLQHLQYVPSAKEIELVARNLPVAISGESTEGDAEVSAFRNLPRVPTNGIRGGACLVIAEGLCQKAAKIRKIVDKLEVPGWEFLKQLGQSKSEDAASGPPRYLAEALGGRPILAYPGKPGGFRLTYGRARTAGLAACAVNPATMVILRNFVAVGTQVKLEYPGKASAIALCDTIEGPIVELDDGSVAAVDDVDHAEAVRSRVRRILDLGQTPRALRGVPREQPGPHARAPTPSIGTSRSSGPSGPPSDRRWSPPATPRRSRARRRFGVPLHPRFLLFWHDLSPREIRALAERVEEGGIWHDGVLRLGADLEVRELLGRLGFLFVLEPEGTVLGDPVSSAALVGGLGLAPEGTAPPSDRPLDPVPTEPLDYVTRLAGVTVRARAPPGSGPGSAGRRRPGSAR